ncbi:hypothetical protein LUZ60_009189 [Juncus effusus]|nr:hypothetical protein LUZ60_009189 [Juncus effusus]
MVSSDHLISIKEEFDKIDDPITSVWRETIQSLYGCFSTIDLSNSNQAATSFFIRDILTLLPIYRSATTPTPTGIVWRWGPKPSYSSQSAYSYLINPGVIIWWQKHLWKIKTPSKVKLFLWLAIHGKILTADNLLKRGWPSNPCCVMCLRAHETGSHLLSDCPYAMGVWTHILAHWDLIHIADHFVQIWRKTTLKLPASIRPLWNTMWGATCWTIWRERNQRIFTGKCRTHRILVNEIKNLAIQWLKYC